MVKSAGRISTSAYTYEGYTGLPLSKKITIHPLKE